jgi:hypothetical protein
MSGLNGRLSRNNGMSPSLRGRGRGWHEDTGSPAEELTAWRSSARGKCVIERPYLSPSGTESFKRSRKKLNEAIAAFADWESRMAAKTEKVSEK